MIAIEKSCTQPHASDAVVSGDTILKMVIDVRFTRGTDALSLALRPGFGSGKP